MNDLLRNVILGAAVMALPLAGCRAEPSNDALANDRPAMESAQMTPTPGANNATPTNPNAQPPNGQQPNAQQPNAQQPNMQQPSARQPSTLQPPQSKAPRVERDGGTMVLPATPLSP